MYDHGNRNIQRMASIVLGILFTVAGTVPCAAGEQTDSAAPIADDKKTHSHVTEAKKAPVPAFEGLAPGFQLQNQYNIVHRHAFPSDRPRIVFIADRHVTNHLAAWYNPIAERYLGPEARESGAYRKKEERYEPPESHVRIIGVAALDDMPVIWKPLVRWARRHYARSSVLLDWRDDVARAYGFVPGKVNVYVIAPDGEVLLHAHGRDPKDELDRVISVVDTSIAKNQQEAEKTIPEAS